LSKQFAKKQMNDSTKKETKKEGGGLSDFVTKVDQKAPIMIYDNQVQHTKA
jgi:hypothetical protein